MKPEDIKITDIARILQGEAPWSFLIEGVIRILFIYLLILVAMRLMGKRMASSLSRNELAALVSLAAAVGIPLQSPDRGLLPALIISVIVVGIQRLVAAKTVKSSKFEKLTQGDISILVEDGKLNLERMKKALVTPERLFAQLRSESIENLGKVQRMYMENTGDFCIIKFKENKVGLSTIPEWDKDFTKEQNTPKGIQACSLCGNISKNNSTPSFMKCERCGNKQWCQAVES